MGKEFNFKLSDWFAEKYEGSSAEIIYTAKLIKETGQYLVTWEDDKDGVPYTKEETISNIDEDYWVIVD